MSLCPFHHVSFCHYVLVCLWICLSIWNCFFFSVGLSTYLSVSSAVSLSVFLSICQLVLFAYQAACLFLSILFRISISNTSLPVVANCSIFVYVLLTLFSWFACLSFLPPASMYVSVPVSLHLCLSVQITAYPSSQCLASFLQYSEESIKWTCYCLSHSDYRKYG